MILWTVENTNTESSFLNVEKLSKDCKIELNEMASPQKNWPHANIIIFMLRIWIAQILIDYVNGDSFHFYEFRSSRIHPHN